MNSGQVKWLSGGGTIIARPLYGKPVTFRPQYLILLVTNHKPHASSDDYALWKRLLLIPFTQSFVDDPKAANEHLRDPQLPEQLKREAPGILAWLVRGCLEFQREGLNPPLSVRAATETYMKDENTLLDFIETRCVTVDGAEVRAGDLYAAYRRWAEECGLSPMTGTAFGKRMAKLFSRTDGMTRTYRGIGLRTQ